MGKIEVVGLVGVDIVPVVAGTAGLDKVDSLIVVVDEIVAVVGTAEMMVVGTAEKMGAGTGVGKEVDTAAGKAGVANEMEAGVAMLVVDRTAVQQKEASHIVWKAIEEGY
eukprot:m.208944 g.208944  ORF g.208944 m.208944 type:complete len:110 (-) comp26094_c1_seq2:101-430(-)